MLRKLVELSNKYGRDSAFVLAGGGNTSCKDADYLYVKGSGTTLADITEQGFVKMDRKALAAIWEKEYPADDESREAMVLSGLMAARAPMEAKRPSVETSLHDLLPYTYVVHLHPALVNGLTCGRSGADICASVFPEAVWIGDSKPGFVLACKVREALEEYKTRNKCDAQVIFLKNHGVFAAADTPEEIDRLYKNIMDSLKNKLTEDIDFSDIPFDRERAAQLAPAIRMLLSEGSSSVVTFCTNKTIARLVNSEEAFTAVSSAYTPDHIVYCRAEALFVKAFEDIDEQYAQIEKSISEYKRANGFNPRVIAVEGLGFFAWGSSKKNADTVRSLFLDAAKIAIYSKSFGGNLFMPKQLIDFIVSWEVESYRAKAADSSLQRRAAEKIMIITGGAQGIGKELANEMLKNGANVLIADMNEGVAADTVSEFKKEFGAEKALYTVTDVSNESSVKEMVIETVLTYGGIDALINNAGIVRAGSLEEMTVQNLDLVTKINYTAYFICTKYASRIMKIQNRFDKQYFADIIQINSKSGLSGSNKNFAYAGSKFGGVGLTQSFALELVEYNIKVNSICPGNFLEGPLWNDPEKGLFVQYLRAGKVPGAKTVDDVRRAYEAKVPMNRGCRAADIASAVLYCMEQRYETGQAIPVTGGQNMLK